jgi:D-galactonate transporter
VTSTASSLEFENATYRKVTWRLMPFLFLCYILNYIDRVNVGFAKLQMQQDLGFSDAVYGTGAGIFFLAYFFLEVPSNILMQKVGARFWMARIMVVWGIVSACMMFIRGTTSFYALRLLLGAAEAGFFPGIILYLTFWYTRRHRVKMIAAFMSAIALSGVFGGPISGWILAHMSGVHGLRGWQWLFLLEGIPSIVVGLMAMFYLDDGPAKAKWLTADERALLTKRLDEEEGLKKREANVQHTFTGAFRSGKVWAFCLIYFGFVMGNYGLGFWLPQIIKETLTKDPWRIGLISMIPWGLGAIAMIVNGHHSDVTGERRWHIVVAGIVGCVAFAVSGLPGISGVAGIIALSFACMGVMSAFTTFWALPAATLSGTAAAAGIAWINSVGNLGAFVSPYVIGHIRDTTKSMTLALMVLSAACLTSVLLALYVTRKTNGPERSTAPQTAIR